MDKNAEQYMNGLRYGFGHARRYGQASLVREAIGGTAKGALLLHGSLDYTAGVIDAALAMVQGAAR